MDPDPAHRYANVRELRDDVAAFIDGFATKAEKAGVIRKSLLLLRRHFLITLSAMLTLIMFLGIAFYAAIEIPRWQSDWIRVARHDFTVNAPDKSLLEFRNPTLQKNTESWEWIPGKGILAREGEYLILSRNAAGNVKVEVTFEFPAITDTLEICINADLDKPVTDWWRSPDSYSFRIAESEGEKDCIVKNTPERRGQQEYIGSTESYTSPHAVITVTAERTDDVLVLKVNGKEHIRSVD